MIHPFGAGDKSGRISFATGYFQPCLPDLAVTMKFFFGTGVRVVPEIYAVHIAEIKPEARLVWMINALAGTWFHGKSTGYRNSFCCEYGKKDRLPKGVIVMIHRKRIAVYFNVYGFFCFIMR